MTKIILSLFLLLQILFWFNTYQIKPKLNIIPPLPSEKEVAALSFGDNQLYFRGLALNLQMAGDTFGRSTPLKDYNYPKLLEWFRLLDRLDADCLLPKNIDQCRPSKSNYMPSVAAYYFSRSQNPKDVKYILDYLEEHSLRDPEANWWWLSQSIYLANSVLGDKQRAIRIANELRQVKTKMPIWARQMEAFLHEDMGDKAAARDVMCDVITKGYYKDIPKRELDFMFKFFEERLKMLPKNAKDFHKVCGEYS